MCIQDVRQDAVYIEGDSRTPMDSLDYDVTSRTMVSTAGRRTGKKINCTARHWLFVGVAVEARIDERRKNGDELNSVVCVEGATTVSRSTSAAIH